MVELLSYSAAVAVLSCLISESTVLAPIRERLNYSLFFCPICLGFWLALPFFYYGFFHYFLVVALSNVWMLVVLKVYEALER